jgi:hypothetical protein
MQKQNRQPGRKYPKRRVITTNDAATSEAFYNKTDTDAPLEPHRFAAGVIQHPTTKLHQVWFSTNGLDVTCLSAHSNAQRAEEDKAKVKRLISSGDIYDEKKIEALFQELRQESEEEPSALPDDLVRAITRAILRAVVDRQPRP